MNEPPTFRIRACFGIAGRGAVVVLDGRTGLPVGRPLRATVARGDGSTATYHAWKERPLRRASPPVEDEAFLLVGADPRDLPVGGAVTLEEGA